MIVLDRTVDPERIALSREATLLEGAIAVVSRGRPVDKVAEESFRKAATAAGFLPRSLEGVAEFFATGLDEGRLSPNGLFNLEQSSVFVASLAFLAARRETDGAVRNGDGGFGRGLGVDLGKAYRLPEALVTSLVDPVLDLAKTLPASTLDDQLADYLDPPRALGEILDRALAPFDPARRPKPSAAWISPSRYQHPLDREALAKVQKIAVFEDMMRVFFEHHIEVLFRVHNIASLIKVGPRQYPDLYKIFRGCVERAGVRPEPELFIQAGGLNAYTFGVEAPYVVLFSGILGLPRAELEFVIAHELGHIRHQHVLYHMIAWFLPFLVEHLPLPLIGSLLIRPFKLALFEWSRASELSADRTALLLGHDLDAAINLMMRFSGAPAIHPEKASQEAFLSQHAEYERYDEEPDSLLYKMLLDMFQTHPYTVVRAVELKKWREGGEFDGLFKSENAGAGGGLFGSPAMPDHTIPVRCIVCGASVPGGDRFCGRCGASSRTGEAFRRCPCGALCGAEQHYCERCGKPIGATAGGACSS